jgi:hypothetical protein
MPPSLSPLAESHYLQQQATARAAADGAQRLWREQPSAGLRDRFAYWRTAIPDLTDTVRLAQVTNATRGVEYVDTAAALQGATSTDRPTVVPSAFTTPADDLEEWLRSPMLHLAGLLMGGAPETVALSAALSTLVRQVGTLVQDAGREAGGVGIYAHPDLKGYFRRLRTPSCKRCAVMAGAFYEDNAGFDRHPLCDCTHVPAAEDYEDGSYDVASAIKRGDITGLTQGERDALLDGADLSQVVNAKRKGSLQRSSMYGTTTTSSTTRRGVYRAKEPRLTPDSIYRQAGGNRDEALRLLRDHGYLA